MISLKIRRRNAEVQPSPPPPRRRVLDRYGRPATPLARPWIWVPKPWMMPFPGIMPQMLPHDAGGFKTVIHVGNGTPGTTAVTLTATRAAGDLSVVCGIRFDANTAITTPSGWTALSAIGGGANRHIDLFYRILLNAADTATGFTGAERCVSWTFRDFEAADPFGDVRTVTSGNSDPLNLLSLTLERTNGTSYVGTIVATRNPAGSTVLDTASWPAGTVSEGVGAVGSAGYYGMGRSDGVVSSFPGYTIADTGNAAAQLNASFEVRAAPL